MKISVQFFAAARDAVGTSPVSVTLPDGCSVARLRQVLVDTFPDLRPLQNVLLIAVNSQYAEDSGTISDTDEVACFPPVSGG